MSERAELLERLRDGIAACERGASRTERQTISTGWPVLDRLLPSGGVRRGALVELIDERAGCGAESLAASLAASTCRVTGTAVVVDRDGTFHPPALAAWGVAFGRMIVVRAAGDSDALWAADQALRCSAVAVVWLRIDRLTPHDFRRLQLAAEEGGALGILFRPARARGQPSWADVQMVVEPRPSARGRRLRVDVTRCRGGTGGQAAIVEFDGTNGGVLGDGHRETLPVPAVPELAGSAPAC